MIFRDIHQKSYLPKLFIALAIFSSIYISGCLMFLEAPNLWTFLKPYKIEGDLLRNILILTCMVIYFLRLLITMFVFFQRKMYWIEALFIANIMPWIFPYVAYRSGCVDSPVGSIEVVGILIYLIGSLLNTTSEFQRYSWKKENGKGRIHTKGLFKYAWNINYFGDIVLFTGMVFVAHRLGLLIVPASMAVIFILILIPLKENYLKKKYGQAFTDYAARTKKLVPFIY